MHQEPGGTATTEPGGQKPSGRRLDLDVVRGLAILLAMGWHLNGPDTGVLVVDWLRAPGSTFGWVGVDLFFVLSGFLMGRIILGERAKTGRFNSVRFMVRRAFKLWPVLYLFLVAQLFLGDNPWRSYFFQVFFHVQNYTGSSHAHLWSLAVEEHFYLALAILMPWFIRSRRSPAFLVGALIAAVVVPLALRVIGVAAGATATHVQQYTHFRLDALAAGVLLAALSMHYPVLFHRLNHQRLACAAVVAAVVVWLCLVPKGTALGSTIGYTLAWMGGAALLLLVLDSTPVNRWPWLFRPLGVIGLYSYAIYVFHIAIARAVELALSKAGVELPPAALVPVLYIGAIVISIAITVAVERPMLRLRDRVVPPVAKATQGLAVAADR